MICQQMYPKFLQKRKINTTGLVFVTMLSLGMLAHVTREHCWNFLNDKNQAHAMILSYKDTIPLSLIWSY